MAVGHPRVRYREFPPMYGQLVAVLGTPPEGAIFTYGDTVYSPAGHRLTPDLEVHELVHMRQQKAVGGPEIWWTRYLHDPAFRYEQELEAYRAQWKSVQRHYRDRNDQARWLHHIGASLAGKMYGKVADAQDAIAAIRA